MKHRKQKSRSCSFLVSLHFVLAQSSYFLDVNDGKRNSYRIKQTKKKQKQKKNLCQIPTLTTNTIHNYEGSISDT